eukprot:13914423-Alexandrium_andersonii.AAC.1
MPIVGQKTGHCIACFDDGKGGGREERHPQHAPRAALRDATEATVGATEAPRELIVARKVGEHAIPRAKDNTRATSHGRHREDKLPLNLVEGFPDVCRRR